MTFFMIFEVLMTYIEGLLGFLLAADVLPCGKTAKLSVLMGLGAISTVIVSLCNGIALVSQYTVFISTVFSAFLIYIFLCKDFVLSAVMSATYHTILLASEMLFISAVSVITNDPELVFKMLSGENLKRVFSVLFLKSVQYAAYFLLRNKIRNINCNILKTKQYMVCIFVGLFMIMEMMGLINQNSINSLKIGLSFMFMVFIAVIMIIINLADTALKSSQLMSEREYINLKNRFLENEIYYMNELYEKNSKNFHDINNHISVMSLMLESKNYAELKEYMDNIKLPIKSKRKFNTGNKNIDIVLNIKYTQIEEKNIGFDFSYSGLEKINIEPQDISSLLFNLIDNSITASSETNERKIALKISVQGNLIIIGITNSCSSDTKTDLNKKSTDERHGWGIKIIKDITSKYNGEYTANTENNVYKTKIILKNNGSDRKNNGLCQ